MNGDIAVLDIGKTNVELWVAGRDGTLFESRSVQNHVLDGPPWRHHDLNRLSAWLVDTLAVLCKRYPIQVLVPVGHGSGGVLAGADPETTGAAFPMIDYEQSCPSEIDAEYAQMAGSFEDRGSSVMMASTHAARQLLWMERADPITFAKAHHYLNIAQYWGWWLAGIPASEYSAMGAQSHLWNVSQRKWSPIVDNQNWQRLMPEFRPAWAPLGPLRASLSLRNNLPSDIVILTGAHDSTANCFRYLAAGVTDFTLVSTGTWIVALSREADIAKLGCACGTTINADMDGNPVGGALTMGGRAFSAIAGPDWNGQPAMADVLTQLVVQGTMALPSFGENEGQFPCSAGQGRILGPSPDTQAEWTALAVLHVALLTWVCADVLNGGTRLILDGTFLKDPLFAPLVAAFCRNRTVEVSHETHGVVAGAVQVACRWMSVPSTPLELEKVAPIAIPGLMDYAKSWRVAANQQGGKAG